MADFDPELCNIRHTDVDRRLTVVEQSIKDNLTRIYDKLETMGKRPSWAVATVIGFLLMISGSMATYLLTH